MTYIHGIFLLPFLFLAVDAHAQTAGAQEPNADRYVFQTAESVASNRDADLLSAESLTRMPGDDAKVPESLTTLFAANGGFRGNMFDIEPAIEIEEIMGMDVNVDPAGRPVTVDVYWREGTCVGHDMDPAGWNLVGSATTTAVGHDLPTFIDLQGNGIAFEADQVYTMKPQFLRKVKRKSYTRFH